MRNNISPLSWEQAWLSKGPGCEQGLVRTLTLEQVLVMTFDLLVTFADHYEYDPEVTVQQTLALVMASDSCCLYADGCLVLKSNTHTHTGI